MTGCDAILEPIVNRDPGDETPERPPVIRNCRSYRATYTLIGGTEIRFQDFIAPADFLAAVNIAEGLRENGWRLVSVKDAEQFDTVNLAHG